LLQSDRSNNILDIDESPAFVRQLKSLFYFEIGKWALSGQSDFARTATSTTRPLILTIYKAI